MPEPTQLAPLDVEEQRLYSVHLPGDRALHPISKGAPRHPAEETHFSRLYPGSYSFGHDPKFMTIGEGRNVDWPVNWELRLSTQLSLHHDRPIQRLHYCGRCTDSPVNLTVHPSLTREQDPKILKWIKESHSKIPPDTCLLGYGSDPVLLHSLPSTNPHRFHFESATAKYGRQLVSRDQGVPTIITRNRSYRSV